MRVVKEANNYITYEDILNNQDKFNIALSKNINSKIEINVLLSNKLEKVDSNKCYILMDKIDINKAREIIMQTWKNLQALGYNNFVGEIKIIVNNQKELALANTISNNSGLKINITKSDLFQKEVQNKETIERIMKANTITKIDNGIMRTYTERTSDDNNLGYMLEGITKEEMYNKLQQLQQQNPTILENKNEQEIANIVLDSIAEENNRQKYYLESVLDQKAQDKRGAIAGVVAYKNEGTVNKEIGIVRNGVEQEDEIKTVEEDDDKLKVVTPEVNEATIGTNTSTNYGFNHQSTNDYYDNGDVQNETEENEENLTEEEKQQREVNKTQTYVRKRVLVKPEEHKSAAFISLPVIVLIISGLLLISSAVIYILSK